MANQRYLIKTESDVASAMLASKRFAEISEFDALSQMSISTAVSELGHNIVKYAGRGEITLRFVELKRHSGIEIVAADSGPGIPDIERALEDHFSSSGTLGMGLPGVRRLMDELEVESNPEEGTRVVARKWRK